ncbi:MAG: RNA polymerase sigma factor [Lachnospiraceae bacterium]|nr:RNA polymerase sigma factor [Lachnospiraceae bacterium]
MSKSKVRTDKEIEEIYMRHSNTIYRICFAYMKNHVDTEDAVQETFFKLIKSRPFFESKEHEKAWLIRTATNICKNILKHWWMKRENIDDFCNLQSSKKKETDDILNLVIELPEKYKTVVYLYYYEGYNSVEIAKIMKKPQSTIRNYLHEARAILKERLGDDFNEE